MNLEGEITLLLKQWAGGDPVALRDLMPLVYEELRRLARGYLSQEHAPKTIQATGLVHEVYLRLSEQRKVHFNNRHHFYGAAARIMRRLLVDEARAQDAQKRGGGQTRVGLTESIPAPSGSDVEVMSLDAALNELEEFDERKARLVELRYFAGLSIEEAAEVMGLSPMTLKRDWAVARAWLYERMTR
jgi:RNA polymerase sigma factor (TIGR02999 family)